MLTLLDAVINFTFGTTVRLILNTSASQVADSQKESADLRRQMQAMKEELDFYQQELLKRQLLGFA